RFFPVRLQGRFVRRGLPPRHIKPCRAVCVRPSCSPLSSSLPSRVHLVARPGRPQENKRPLCPGLSRCLPLAELDRLGQSHFLLFLLYRIRAPTPLGSPRFYSEATAHGLPPLLS